MPLVLAASAPTASGHAYNDILGVQYEYPAAYLNRMVPGTAFVHYRGSRARNQGVSGNAYFGAGVLGHSVRASEGRYVATVLDYVSFDEPVPFKDGSGSYLEPGANTNVNHFIRGVRWIDYDPFVTIVAQGGLVSTDADAEVTGDQMASYGSDQQLMRDVEEYAVEVAVMELQETSRWDRIVPMPRNNPGFDLRAFNRVEEIHIEVKGTRRPDPVFFISEGERVHSEQFGDHFQLCVVYDINLSRRTHLSLWRQGTVRSPQVVLTPSQWTGRVSLR